MPVKEEEEPNQPGNEIWLALYQLVPQDRTTKSP